MTRTHLVQSERDLSGRVSSGDVEGDQEKRTKRHGRSGFLPFTVPHRRSVFRTGPHAWIRCSLTHINSINIKHVNEESPQTLHNESALLRINITDDSLTVIQTRCFREMEAVRLAITLAMGRLLTSMGLQRRRFSCHVRGEEDTTYS